MTKVITDAHSRAVARKAREGWEATQAELDQAHADAAAIVDAGTYTDRAAHQMVPANRDDEAEVSERVLANTIHCVQSSPLGTPLSATKRHVADMEN